MTKRYGCIILGDKAGNNKTDYWLELCDEDILTPLQIEARYPEYKEKISEALTFDYCKQLLTETEALLCWIKHRLEK